jgi:hypothetical protein
MPPYAPCRVMRSAGLPGLVGGRIGERALRTSRFLSVARFWSGCGRRGSGVPLPPFSACLLLTLSMLTACCRPEVGRVVGESGGFGATVDLDDLAGDVARGG